MEKIKNKYDLTVLLRKEDVSSLKKIIKEHNGDNIFEIKSLTKINLAYPIKKEDKAFMISLGFEMEADKIEKLEKALKLDDDFLRYLILKDNDKGKKEIVREKPEKKRVVKINKKEDFISNEDLEEKIKEISE